MGSNSRMMRVGHCGSGHDAMSARNYGDSRSSSSGDFSGTLCWLAAPADLGFSVRSQLVAALSKGLRRRRTGGHYRKRALRRTQTPLISVANIPRSSVM